MSYWRLQNVFFLAFCTLLGLFFTGVGLVAMYLSSSQAFQNWVVRLLTHHSFIVAFVGMVFFILGFSVFALMLTSRRRQYYHLKQGKHLVVLNEKLFEQYLQDYWKQLFPHASVGHKVLLKKNQLHILADLPPVSLSQQKFLLEKIRAELKDLFLQFLGFRGELFFSARFC